MYQTETTMRIVIIHFHLKTGGVTSVVKQQAICLSNAGHQVLLLSGETPSQKMPAPVAVVAGLAYDNERVAAFSPMEISAAIVKAIHDQFGYKKPDLIHIHNPTLAKNCHLQMILNQLQQLGYTLLCQVHDFAEDGRPDVYFDGPYLGNCHYAVVNQRDRSLLCRAGLHADGVHHLPNAVIPPGIPIEDIKPQQTGSQGPILYPVRAIRRKNIGEAILLKLFSPDDVPLMITQPPNSQRDKPSYAAWQNLCAQHRLPVVFEAGLKHRFQRLMADCRYVITTSITEGFGFTFLESWTAGKALWGRLLSDICQDFSSQGVNLNHLYNHLMVPLELLDAQQLKKMWCGYLRKSATHYDFPLSDDAIDSRWQTVTQNSVIDFSLLEESFQQVVLNTIIRDPQAQKALETLNPFLNQPGPPVDSSRLIADNRAAVRRHFSLEAYEQRLLTIYQVVLENPIEQSIDKSVLLDFFMAAQRFSLLKWGRYHG